LLLVKLDVHLTPIAPMLDAGMLIGAEESRWGFVVSVVSAQIPSALTIIQASRNEQIFRDVDAS
jgi:hypothetical protein